MEGDDVLRQSKVKDIILCNAVLIALATFGVVLRVWVRVRYLNGIDWDDVFCALSWVCAFALCFICAYMTKYGYGKHIQLVQNDMPKLKMFLKLDFATMIIYLFALNFIKISFCLFYLKLLPGNRFRIACWVLIFIVSAQCIEETFVVIFQCSPVNKAWDASGDLPGKCLNLTSFYYISFAIKLVTDLVLFMLPIPKVLRVRLSWGKKWGVVFMFSLGLLVCVTSIIRATYLSNISLDHTWFLVAPLNWSSVEVCIAILIACIPSFKALITLKLPALGRFLGLSTRENTQPYPYPGTPGRYGLSGQTGTGTGTNGKATRSYSRVQIRLHDLVFLRPKLRTEISSRSGSEERIVSEQAQQGITVTTTTNVVVGKNESDS